MNSSKRKHKFEPRNSHNMVLVQQKKKVAEVTQRLYSSRPRHQQLAMMEARKDSATRKAFRKPSLKSKSKSKSKSRSKSDRSVLSQKRSMSRLSQNRSMSKAQLSVMSSHDGSAQGLGNSPPKMQKIRKTLGFKLHQKSKETIIKSI